MILLHQSQSSDIIILLMVKQSVSVFISELLYKSEGEPGWASEEQNADLIVKFTDNMADGI